MASPRNTEGKKAGQQVGLLETQHMLLLASEAAWVYGWLLITGLWLGSGRSSVLDFAIVAATLAGAAVSARLAIAIRGRDRSTAAILALLGLAVTCLIALGELPRPNGWGDWRLLWTQLQGDGVPARSVWAACVALFLWWRGLSIGGSRPTQSDVEDDFRLGIMALAALFVAVALAGVSAHPISGQLVLMTILLISSGLVGMPLSRIVDESRSQRRRDEAPLSPGTAWLGMLLSVVAGVLLVTMLLAQFFTFERIGSLLEPLAAPLGAILWGLIYAVALPMGLLAELVIRLGRMVFHGSGLSPSSFDPTDMSWLDALRNERQPSGFPPELLLAIKVVAAVVLGIVALWILVRAFTRIGGWWQHDDVEEIHDSVWSWPGVGALWRLLAGRLNSPSGTGVSDDGANPDTTDAGRIRQIYRQLLLLGDSIGHPRQPWETPLEYESRLKCDSCLQGEDEVQLVTESYLRVRYASPNSGQPNPDRVRSALDQLQALWQAHLTKVKDSSRSDRKKAN